MTLPALAVLVVAAAASAQGRGSQKPAVDPKALPPEARAAYEADPAAFEREHAADLDTLRRWSQDPALGQKECVEARKEPRSCMESRVKELSQVATPEALAVIDAYVKLMPRGVSASVPEKPGEGLSGVARSPASPTPLAPLAPQAAMSPSAPLRASEFRPGPNSLQLSPVPLLAPAPARAADAQAPAAPMAPAEKPWWEQQYDLYLCFYLPAKCPK